MARGSCVEAGTGREGPRQWIKGAPTREGRPLRMAPCGCRAPPRATCSSRKVPRRAASGFWTTVGVRALLPGAAVRPWAPPSAAG